MKAGDIIFVRGDSPLSSIIKFFDRGDFSHVAIAVSENEIFEAQYYMRASITEMNYKDYEIVSLNLTNKEVEKLVVICNMLQGKWYDYLQAISYIFKYYFKSGIVNNPNNLICSEALGLILFVLDKTPILDTNITPNELYDLLK
jgi:hypothetical protein